MSLFPTIMAVVLFLTLFGVVLSALTAITQWAISSVWDYKEEEGYTGPRLDAAWPIVLPIAVLYVLLRPIVRLGLWVFGNADEAWKQRRMKQWIRDQKKLEQQQGVYRTAPERCHECGKVK